VVAVAAQLWGLYRPVGVPSAPLFPHADKVEHLVGFGIPLLLVLVTLGRWSTVPGLRLARRPFLLAVGGFMVHGAISEIVQGTFYTTRSADPLDLVADWTGIMLAVLAYRLLTRRRSGRATP
jgi:hypothetical protein